MSTALPPIATVPALDTDERAAILDLLFEPCTQLHTLSVSTLREKAFRSYDELAAAVGEQLRALSASQLRSDQAWLDVILNAHPRLGEKKVESELSRREQAAMGAGGAEGHEAEAEAEELRRLNGRVFVNGRSRRVVMADMERRIQRGDLQQEKLDAIQAMCEIAADRARTLAATRETVVP